jgi:hypothetical protein
VQFDTGWLAESAHGGLVVAILGAVDAHDQPVLRRMLHHAGSALAIALDVEQWQSGGRREQVENAAQLGRQGWRAVDLRPGDRLDSVWQELGRSSARNARLADRERIQLASGAAVGSSGPQMGALS